MKKLIIIVGLFLIINSTFAEGEKEITKEEIRIELNMLLKPITPKEATFEEETINKEIINLAPTTPKEATFEDEN